MSKFVKTKKGFEQAPDDAIGDDVFDWSSDAVQAWIIDGQCKLVDSDVDAIYRDAVGNRSIEYEVAESQALAYKSQGYSGAVPSCVLSYSTAASITPKQAADAILDRAAALRSAVEVIRSRRLQAKADFASKVSGTQIRWSSFVISIRAQLGV